MAEIRKRSDRRRRPWIVDFLDNTGRRHRLAAETKAEAQKLLVEKTGEAARLGPSNADREITVSEYAETWLARVQSELKYASVKAYAYCLRVHIIPAFGASRVCELNRFHVKQWLDSKRDTGLSRASIAHFRAVLSAVLSEAVEDGLLANNPALAVGRQKRRTTSVATDSIRPFSETEVAQLLDATPDHATRTLLMLLARSGLRPGEAIALQWSDLDLSNRQILVERALYDGHVDTPKSGKSRRVDMSAQLAAALSALYVQREKETLAGSWSELPAWVFLRRDGQPLKLERARHAFARAMKRAGLSGHVLYDLRHTFITTLLAKGAPLTYISRQAGHNKPTTTLSFYAHWIPNADRSFVDALDQPSLAPLAPLSEPKSQHSEGKLAETSLCTP